MTFTFCVSEFWGYIEKTLLVVSIIKCLFKYILVLSVPSGREILDIAEVKIGFPITYARRDNKWQIQWLKWNTIFIKEFGTKLKCVRKSNTNTS